MALTGTYSNGTLSITKAESASEALNYDANIADFSSADGTFGSDVTVIDANKVSKALAANVVDSKVTSLTLGKGADAARYGRQRLYQMLFRPPEHEQRGQEKEVDEQKLR